MGSNFSFLIPEFRELAELAVKSERLVMGDARAVACAAITPLRNVVFGKSGGS